jgi:hypothetical protein
MLFTGLAVIAAFLLGLRAGIALGHRNAIRRLPGGGSSRRQT